MNLAIKAIYEGGKLRPLEPLELAEHTVVRISLETGQDDSRDRLAGEDPSGQRFGPPVAGVFPAISHLRPDLAFKSAAETLKLIDRTDAGLSPRSFREGSAAFDQLRL